MSNADQRPPEPPAISFAPPFIDEATVSAVERVLRSGWITTGPETAAFEQELARYLGVDHVACGGSWTGLAGVILDCLASGQATGQRLAAEQRLAARSRQAMPRR